MNRFRQDITLPERRPEQSITDPEITRYAVSEQRNGDVLTDNSLYDGTTDDDHDTDIHPLANNTESPLFNLQAHNIPEGKNTDAHSPNKLSNYKKFKLRIRRLRVHCSKFSESQKFSLIVLLAILANTIVMAIEHHNQVRLILCNYKEYCNIRRYLLLDILDRHLTYDGINLLLVYLFQYCYSILTFIQIFMEISTIYPTLWHHFLDKCSDLECIKLILRSRNTLIQYIFVHFNSHFTKFKL